jgi:hypothetical protein
LSHWAVESESEAGLVKTDYQFLGWDDLVRENWTSETARLVWESCPVYLAYLLNGGFQKVRRLSSSAFFSGTLPPAYLFLLLGVVACFFWAASLGGRWVSHSEVVGWLCGAAAAFGVWRLGGRFAERLGLFWLLRTYVFLYRWRLGRIPEVDRRVGEMAEQIYRSAVDDPVDEILVVGHSVGTVLAVSVMARFLEKMEAESEVALLSKVHVLTLGHCIPLVLFLPGSARLSDDLAVLAAEEGLRWTDVSAKADPLCFFQTDPIRVAGVEEAGRMRPRLRRVRFHKMFPREVYLKMRPNKMRLHFQYLMAAALPSAYDYFAITGGPERLEEQLETAECVPEG